MLEQIVSDRSAHTPPRTARRAGLWDLVQEKTRAARADGVLRPIETETLRLEDEGVEFLIRRVTQLADKPRGGGDENPFLQPEPALDIGDITPSHFCVLNKYNVIDHHLLIATKHFEPQETLLRMRDFHALSACLGEIDGLAFYNAGPVAGASQTHKHLQLVPLPLAEGSDAPPMLSLLSAVNGVGARIRNAPGLPFAHAFAWVSPTLFDDEDRAGEVTYDLYVDMMEALGMRGTRTDGEFRQPVPYNLLLTRRWMMLVPRRAEHFRGISINGLGFAGSLFVRDECELETLREHGPMTALTAVAKKRA